MESRGICVAGELARRDHCPDSACRLKNIPGEDRKEPIVAKSLEKTDAKKSAPASSGSSNSSGSNGSPVPGAASSRASTVGDRDPSRDSALSRAVQQIEKQFGKGAVMKLDGNKPANIEGIATGS